MTEALHFIWKDSEVAVKRKPICKMFLTNVVRVKTMCTAVRSLNTREDESLLHETSPNRFETLH